MSSTDDDLDKQFGQLFGDDVEPLRGKGANPVSYTHLTLPTTPYV